MANSTSVMEQLAEFSWRGISVPATRFSLGLGQSLVQHKWVDRDGAHVEGTGRDPLTFHFSLAFRNGLAPGKSEHWGILYPDTFRTFLAACADRSSGKLQHPELGLILCKFERLDAVWEATKRDGVDVEATWIETFDEEQNFEDVLASPSPIAEVLIESLDMDTQMAQLPESAQQPEEPLTFEESIRNITSVADQAGLVSKKAAGSIAHVLYRLERLTDSLFSLKDATVWPAMATAERLKAALRSLEKLLLVNDRRILIYITPNEQMLAQLAATLGNSVTELLTLNPTAANGPVVSRHLPIRYYAKPTL